LGHPWLEKDNPDINWKKGTVTWRKEETPKQRTTMEEENDDQEWMNRTRNPSEKE